jgi:hypothetical protein
MRLSGEVIEELSLRGLITPVRGARPLFTLSPLDSGERLLIHEETVCIIYLFINDACFFCFPGSFYLQFIHITFILHIFSQWCFFVLFLFIYGLFNDAVTISCCMVPDSWMINELERI